MADVEEMMISEGLRLVMCGRRIVSRTENTVLDVSL
jgi:hypothetical protein